MRLKAHAKLNLFLDLKQKLPNCYHEVEFVNTQLVLHDTITLTHRDEGIRVECTHPEVPKYETNVCWKIAEIMRMRCNGDCGVTINIKKRIPVSAGFGGGSADAAATLIGLNELWDLQLSQEEMVYELKKISTDACYSVVGNTCIVNGIGDIVQQIEPAPKMYIVLVRPDIKLPQTKTKWMYKQIQVNEGKYDASKMVRAIKSGDIERITKNMRNRFETLRIPDYKPVFELISKLKKHSLNAMLAGSGPSVVAVTKTEKQAIRLKDKLKKEHRQVYVTETL